MQSYHCFDPELFLSSPRKSAAAGKFVLLQRLQEVILLIGQLSSYPYHADLVQAFAERHAIPFQRASVREKTVLTSNNHELFGGGWIDLDYAKRTARFHGHSTAYGDYSREILQALVLALPELAEWNVNIDE